MNFNRSYNFKKSPKDGFHQRVVLQIYLHSNLTDKMLINTAGMNVISEYKYYDFKQGNKCVSDAE